MEWQNLPKHPIIEKIEEHCVLNSWDEYYIDNEGNIYINDGSDDSVDGGIIFRNIETDEKIAADDLVNFAEELDIEELEDEAADFEVTQWFLLSDSDAEYLIDHTDEIVTYVDEIDCYFWGVTHYGTSWDGINVTLTYDY